jgi:DNA-binding CsgD family transcriptional regulator
MLRGRDAQRRALDALLAAARSGSGSALVLRGEAGIGKTALLDYAVGAADGFRVLRATGADTETELPFAALHQLIGRLTDRLDRLPDPQAQALGVAFGLQLGAPPEPFLVGLAVLNLLADLADDQPVLCAIDDAHFVDQASALVIGFVARRLSAERVAVLLAAQDSFPDPAFPVLPALDVGPLADDDARALLAAATPWPLDPLIRDRVIAEARGNPLALAELPRGPAGELAGRSGPLAAARPGSGLEESFAGRVEALPAATRQLLLVAAAEPYCAAKLLQAAAARLGVTTAAAAPAEAAGLITLGAHVEFGHPLMRSAVYRQASVTERRSAHQALAEVMDPEADRDRRVWHRAQACAGPDNAVAVELEESAAGAVSRGGLAAAAALLERACLLTPGGPPRGRRALAAAEMKIYAGDPTAALTLLAGVPPGELDERGQAMLELLCGRASFLLSRAPEAPERMLQAAQRLQRFDVLVARETYLEAVEAATFTGSISSDSPLPAIAAAARRAPAPPGPARALDLLLDGIALTYTEGDSVGVPAIKTALAAFKCESHPRWLGMACHTAMAIWDDESCRLLSDRRIRAAREAGALYVLPLALNYMAGLHLNSGEFNDAAALIGEADSIAKATGGVPFDHAGLMLAGWRGSDDSLAALQARRRRAEDEGDALTAASAELAEALLHNGHRRYGDALAASAGALRHDQFAFGMWVLPEMIEAAARSGDTRQAAAVTEQLLSRTTLSGTDYAAGQAARARALVAAGAGAEAHYQEAASRFAHAGTALPLARVHLLYGEWLRRERRQREARDQLRLAQEMFTRIGALAFAGRAASELQVLGIRTARPSPARAPRLTGQESQIAKLASEGYANSEIGTLLFISSRTVEYHLHKTFTKLGITSRNQLHQALNAVR